MKSMLKFIAAAVIGAATLTACGGHYKKPETVVVAQPDYKQTDTVVGTGQLAELGTVKEIVDGDGKTVIGHYLSGSQLVTVKFSGYLYDATKADGKGALFETSTVGESISPVTPFTLGAGQPITGTTTLLGLDRAVLGMRVGGKRTALFPAPLAYGAASRLERTVGTVKYPALPANSPMVYDIELQAITVLPDIKWELAPQVVTDLVTPVIGTGAAADAGKTAVVRYSLYYYDGTRASRRGALIESNVTATAGYSFVVDSGSTIKGFNDTIKEMKVGGKRTVILPWALAYGATGTTTIAPYTSLVYELTLESVN